MADTQRMSSGQLTDWVMNFLGCIKSEIIAYFNIAPDSITQWLFIVSFAHGNQLVGWGQSESLHVADVKWK